MIFIEKRIQDVERNPQTLLDAADAATKADELIAQETVTIYPEAIPFTINASGIQDDLIHIVGRYCERFASDLIATFSDLQAFLIVNEMPTENNRWIIGVGIRESGVDHNSFIMSTLSDQAHRNLQHYVYPKQVYRHILVIDITDTKTENNDVERVISLRDVTRHLIRLHDDDYHD